MYFNSENSIEFAVWIVMAWAITSAGLFLIQIFISWRLLGKAMNKIMFYFVFLGHFIAYSLIATIAGIGAAALKQNRSDLFFVMIFLLFYFVLSIVCYVIQKPKSMVDRFLFFSLPMSAAFNSSVIWSRNKYLVNDPSEEMKSY